MKIYISADMEGIGGVALPEQLARGTAEYAEARHFLTGEVNAAIAGAFDGGATEVIVKDAHATGFNLVLENVDARAEIELGGSIFERFPGLEAGVAGVFLVGYHAMAGTIAAICDHTMSTASWNRYELCGREVGEIGMDAALAGIHGVPVLLVTGDDKASLEARETLGPLVGVCAVKKGLGRHTVRTKTPAACRALVRAAAQKALEAPFPPPYQPAPPYEARLTYVLTSHADGRFLDGETAVRVDGRTVLYRDTDLGRLILRTLR